ncbi:hypothetical protein AGOR_G00115570 [Albula goreensis]|uniref:Phosphatidylinositol-glycan biosynthesis class F protein n=1 Tax=Albula goreensis TaxID=1534307 RepID=A0A8T3DJC3_9TELE|nr:hypothetical protein AGOR_G00115570 [Albula goreensis]
MREHEIKGMVSAHTIIASSIFIATVMPLFFVEHFSVYGTHLTWLYSVSGSVAVVNIIIFWLLGISPPTKKHTLGYKVSRAVRSCLYFVLSCLFFHLVVVLTVHPCSIRCLCVLGPNVQTWIRVFSRDGAMSVWDTSLQITTASSVIGAWLGAFPIPLDWDRPWQVWPISCSLGATFGFLTGLIIAPAWIHWHRKQLTYKSK